tara:strand:- start:351 stop:1613 length:1263 start_codon:yes stop_codon:yes gene_type:complete
MKITFKANGTPAQLAFWRSPSKRKLLLGGVGSGKTYAGCFEMVSRLANECRPGAMACVVAPTYKMLRDATMRTFMSILPGDIIKQYNRSNASIELVTGQTIIFRSADKGGEKLRGLTLAMAWIDEAAQVERLVFDILSARLRAIKAPRSIICTTTPRGFNWVHDLWVRHPGKGFEMFHAPTSTNTYLSSDYLENLKLLYTSEFAQQELEGAFINPQGALFKRDWFNIVSHAPPGLQWFRYVDLAFSQKRSADYTASLRAAMDISGNVYYAAGYHGRWDWPTARRRIKKQALKEPRVVLGIESVGAQLGPAQDILSLPELASHEIKFISPKRDKITRASALAARAEQGKVFIVDGKHQSGARRQGVPSWSKSFLDELCLFPDGAHDDWVDAATGALLMVAKAPSEVAVPATKPIFNNVQSW